MGSIKDRNDRDLTEAEDIKKRWQECTEELYKKDLHNQHNHDDVITNLEPDILECEVKWSLGSITTDKASGGDGIPVELFQILKDDVIQVLACGPSFPLSVSLRAQLGVWRQGKPFPCSAWVSAWVHRPLSFSCTVGRWGPSQAFFLIITSLKL